MRAGIEMLRSVRRELGRWRYEWVPFVGFVLVLVNGYDDLSFFWPWLFSMVCLFALAWSARTAPVGRQRDELSIPVRSQILVAVAIGLVSLVAGVLIIFVPTGAGTAPDKALLLLAGAASGINLLKALTLAHQRTTVRGHWETAHPGAPFPTAE
jgi:hypothetical protein